MGPRVKEEKESLTSHSSCLGGFRPINKEINQGQGKEKRKKKEEGEKGCKEKKRKKKKISDPNFFSSSRGRVDRLKKEPTHLERAGRRASF